MEFEVRVAKGARRSGKGGGKWWPLRRRWRPLQTCNLVIFEGMLKMGHQPKVDFHSNRCKLLSGFRAPGWQNEAISSTMAHENR